MEVNVREIMKSGVVLVPDEQVQLARKDQRSCNRVSHAGQQGLYLKGRNVRLAGTFVLVLLMLALPALLYSQSPSPPVGAPLVREGQFAVSLAQALGIGNTTDEVEAESLLGSVGIAPRNGWIADYPVTPDIVGELQRSVADAADSRRIQMGREEALQQFGDVNVQASLSVVPYTGNETSREPFAPEDYPNPAVVNDYYGTEGPPIVTYYTPPPDYYYLYSWIPYPFWCRGFWFPGFFVLHDFHRIVNFHNRPFFVSNHFNDIGRHRLFRIDPGSRFNGRTFAGIGAPRTQGSIPSGVPHSERRIFNAPPTQMAPGGGTSAPGSGRPGTTAPGFGRQGVPGRSSFQGGGTINSGGFSSRGVTRTSGFGRQGKTASGFGSQGITEGSVSSAGISHGGGHSGR
jgi:hypothetical protein